MKEMWDFHLVGCLGCRMAGLMVAMTADQSVGPWVTLEKTLVVRMVHYLGAK